MDEKVHLFLQQAGWGDAVREALAGDASSRCYERLQQGDNSAILMQDPDHGALTSFLSVTDILVGYGYSVPDILCEDKAAGLLLLEDLGDDLLARLLDVHPQDEERLYALAVDFLVDLRRQATPEGLPFFSSNYVLDQNALFLDWYVPEVTGAPLPDNARFFFQQIWRDLLKNMEDAPEILLLRDFHAENLLYLPDRQGVKTLGLLDYQDAMTGPAAYDLVSLLQDARRHVSPAVATYMVTRYLAATGVNEAAFHHMFAVLGAHRALRIMGIFTRLAKRDGKDRYLAFMPRMISHLQTNLAHPNLIALKHWVDVTLGKLN